MGRSHRADGPGRADPGWLRLREPADAAARSPELVDEVRRHLPTDGVLVCDLGSGTGSMARWLAGRLAGRQHWVMYDRDGALLPLAAADPPRASADDRPVTVETRHRDITRLHPGELAGADLVTASALLDMMTVDELDRFVTGCARAGCPVLVALSVTGHVDLTPADPLDPAVAEAFNDHQRRDIPAGRLLGPDAAGAAVAGFRRLGHDVLVRPSPWRLGPDQGPLAASWFSGWLGAASAQRPELTDRAASYRQRRLAQAASGDLSVTVHHLDLLAVPT